MITKGIIEGVNLENYSVKVRLPVFDKIPGDPNATSYDALPPATICVPKGQYPQFNIGDVVFVGFENNNRSNPVILGMLFKDDMGKELIKSVSQVLEATDEAYLPKNTKVDGTNIQSLAYPVGSIYQNADPLFDAEGTFGGKWQHYTLNTSSTYISRIDSLSDYYRSNSNVAYNKSISTTNATGVIAEGTQNMIAGNLYHIMLELTANGSTHFYHKIVRCTKFTSPWNSSETGVTLGISFYVESRVYNSYILQQDNLKLEINGYNKTSGWPSDSGGLDYLSFNAVISIFDVTKALTDLRDLNKYTSIVESNLNQYTLRYDFYTTTPGTTSHGELFLGENSNYVIFKVFLNSDTWFVAFYEKTENQTVSIFIVPVTPPEPISATIFIDSINTHNYWRRIE